MKPKYIAIAAITIDGKIAKHSGHQTNWTSKEDKDFLHAKLDECELVIVGRKTYDLAQKPLSKRNCLVFTKKVKSVKTAGSALTYCNPATFDFQSYAQKKSYKKIAILGGGQVYNYFLKNNLIDEIYLTIEPIIFGSGLSLFDIPLKTSQTLKLVSTQTLNKTGSILLCYKK